MTGILRLSWILWWSRVVELVVLVVLVLSCMIFFYIYIYRCVMNSKSFFVVVTKKNYKSLCLLTTSFDTNVRAYTAVSKKNPAFTVFL